MKLPLLSGKQVVSTLTKIGFIELHIKGSHCKMKHPDGRIVVFPYHKKIDRYTLKVSLNQGDVDINDFISHL